MTFLSTHWGQDSKEALVVGCIRVLRSMVNSSPAHLDLVMARQVMETLLAEDHLVLPENHLESLFWTAAEGTWKSLTKFLQILSMDYRTI